MADASKAHKLKLANSRKRFKELQELKKQKNASNLVQENADNDGPERTPAGSLSSSTHSSINEINSVQNSQLPTYFNDNNYGDNSVFFDTISSKRENNIYIPPSTENFVENVENKNFGEQHSFENSYSLFNHNNQQSYVKETQQIIRPCADSLTLEDPVIEQNDIFEHHRKRPDNLFSDENNQSVLDYLQTEVQQVSDLENRAIENEIVQNSYMAQEGVQHSNISNYITNQMTNYEPHESFIQTESMSDVEKRNVELGAQIEQEKFKSEQQNIKIKELETKIIHLENEISITNEYSNEINKLKDELKCHSQTIRLLVNEKSELSTSLSLLETNFKQKSAECEELQARLKNSRSRAFELEQELNSLRSEKIKKESNGLEQNEILGKLQRDFDNLYRQNEELNLDLLEVRENLKSTSDEKNNLLKINEELLNKLALAEVKIQQLGGTNQSVDGEFEKMVHEKKEMEKELVSLNTMMKSVMKERDESTAHYQHYTEELNAQIVTLQEQYQKLQQENENLAKQEESRIIHIGELERQLQILQNERISIPSSFGNGSLKTDFEETKELCIQLQMELSYLQENHTKTLNEKEMLLKELSAKNDSLNQLEIMVEQLRGNQPDSVKLLATMESDKVAAARAVQQNKELKEQLESMQEVFTKLNNDKVELTEKLTCEVSSNKDLLDKLQKTELQLQKLTDAIEIKDRELSLLRETSSELNKQVLQHEQLADRLRHYEAHDNSSHVLQNELQEAKQTIIQLTNEINVLRNSTTNLDTLEETMNMKRHVDKVKLKNEKLESKLEIDNNNTLDSMLEKEEAMIRLEEKVKCTMQEIADLTDEKQRLEHLVLQLQGETETIGEYVALYQHQRMMLKKKAIEKDEQLKQLALDREHIKRKLDKLNELIQKLINEKQINKDVLNEFSVIRESEEQSTEANTVNKNVAADEILTLLSEIKTSNLVEPKSVHSCPFCSGQLITV